MAKMQFLTILLAVTCFMGGVVSVTDKEFEDIVKRVYQLEEENKALKEESEQQNLLIGTILNHNWNSKDNFVLRDLIQNSTLEERVELLEIQVVVIQDEVSDLETDVDFLFDEQVIQDERLFSLEQATVEINSQLVTVNVEIADLQDTTLALDFRVTILEENGGSDGNSSVAELEVRVGALEETVVDHETRNSTTESDVIDLEGTVSNHETRLTTAEENIQGLQMTDVELDARLTALEENGGGNVQNGTIAFTAALTSYSSIPESSTVEFNQVLLNEGDGYDSSTGVFTVPAGGDGFSVYFSLFWAKFAYFDIEINGEVICTAEGDESESTFTDRGHTSCSGATFAAEGDTVEVIYKFGSDSTPLLQGTDYHYNSFTGFRI